MCGGAIRLSACNINYDCVWPARSWALSEQHHKQREADDYESDGWQNAGQRANLWLKHLFFSFYAAPPGSPEGWAVRREPSRDSLTSEPRDGSRRALELDMLNRQYGDGQGFRVTVRPSAHDETILGVA